MAPAHLATITIDYPLEGSIFPPEITPPTFIWRDAAEHTTRWRIEVAFGDGSPGIQVESRGEPIRIGEIDERCITATNELPKLTPEQAAAHTWTPDTGTWEAIKRRSVVAPAAVTITGFREKQPHRALSRGRVAIQTSKDPVGAPIFYRDVPLAPSESLKGVIQPLAPDKVYLVQWQLRNIGEPQGRVVLKNMPTCGNCHSFSLDGKTMGMDLDGPQNNKGLYAIVPVKPQMTIRNTDVVEWNPPHDKRPALSRVGFMSQVSPDGKYVVTTVHSAARSFDTNYYTVNFKDYRFLQVFYPTRGILAWYSRETGLRKPLQGADDPRYVQTDGVWSPDGKYLVFARAEAKDPYPPDGKIAEYANDPKELQIRYDLYRIPFNGGQGGQPVPIAGASGNGMSNTFPKVSPDGRWIVFVQCRNGQLMRPDSQLYIVPVEGGQARRMRCNTSLMNSWHSFSPNGRWMVFSSKSRGPYTKMYLTHIDEEGQDSPAILIENSTLANRAVNLPEFVNIPPDGMLAISAPAVDIYNKFVHTRDIMKKGQYEAAIPEWRELLQMNPDDYRIHNNLALALAQTGQLEEAIAEYEKALEFYPYSAEAYTNLGLALATKGRLDEARAAFEKAVDMNPTLLEARYNLGVTLASQGQLDRALPHFEKAVEINSNSAEAHYDLAIALASRGEPDQALLHFAKTVELNPDFAEAHCSLGTMLYAQARVQEALAQWREALRLNPNFALAMMQTAHALAASPEASDRNGAEAVKLAEQAVQLSGARNPAYLDTLAAAYAEAGRFPEAVETARRALELARQLNQGDLVEALNARIKLYEAQKPYRATMGGAR
jgi:tetratricopeptide (TPR) repeat protein